MKYQIDYKHLTSSETELLYILCAKCYSEMSPSSNFSIDALLDTGKIRKEKREELLSKMMNNLLKVVIYEDMGSAGKRYSTFITKYTIDIWKNKLIYELSQEGYMILGDFVRTYDPTSFVEGKKLKGKYSNKIYQLLKPREKAGYTKLEIGEFLALLGMPVDYPIKELSRVVIVPSLRRIERNGLLSDISYKYEIKGKKATHVIFTWNTDEDKLINKEKKPHNFEGGNTLMDENFNILYPYE